MAWHGMAWKPGYGVLMGIGCSLFAALPVLQAWFALEPAGSYLLQYTVYQRRVLTWLGADTLSSDSYAWQDGTPFAYSVGTEAVIWYLGLCTCPPCVAGRMPSRQAMFLFPPSVTLPV